MRSIITQFYDLVRSFQLVDPVTIQIYHPMFSFYKFVYLFTWRNLFSAHCIGLKYMHNRKIDMLSLTTLFSSAEVGKEVRSVNLRRQGRIRESKRNCLYVYEWRRRLDRFSLSQELERSRCKIIGFCKVDMCNRSE